jgi:hypothetical protein
MIITFYLHHLEFETRIDTFMKKACSIYIYMSLGKKMKNKKLPVKTKYNQKIVERDKIYIPLT